MNTRRQILRLPFAASGPPQWPFAVLAALHMTLVFCTSSGAGAGLAAAIPGSLANLLHVPSGFVLGALVLRAVVPGQGLARPASWPGLVRGTAPAVLGVVLVHALSNEVHQFFVPGRTCALSDVFLDGAGAGLVLLAPIAGAPGRPRGFGPFAALAAAAAAVGIMAARVHAPGDGVLAQLLAGLGFHRA